MGLRGIGATLPPGFRFYPSDEELVCHYLYKKITNEQVLKGTLVEIDLHTCEPWQLPEVAKLNANEWYFFSFRDRKYATGFRTNRATISGYWKATGKDRTVLDPGTKEIVGMRKTLVFYRNRAPNGIKTGWIMHEFRLQTPHMPPKEDWVLCRVFHKTKSAENNTDDHQFVYETRETNHSTTTTNNNNAPLIRSSIAAAVASSSPTNLPNNHHHQNHHQPCGYHHHHHQPQQLPSFSPSSTPPHHHQIHDQGSLLNLLQQEIRNQSSNNNLVTSAHDQILCGTKGVENIDDEYGGFLWDEMNLEETSLGEEVVVPSHLENQKRNSYDHIHDDGSVVFL